MTGTDTSWRQLRDVVGGLLDKIEPAPTPTGTTSKRGHAVPSR